MQRLISLCIHIRTFGDKQFGDFLVTSISRQLQRSLEKASTLRIHIRTFGDKQFSDFLATVSSRRMQRSPPSTILSVYIRTSSNELFHGFDVTTASSSSDSVAVVVTPAP